MSNSVIELSKDRYKEKKNEFRLFESINENIDLIDKRVQVIKAVLPYFPQDFKEAVAVSIKIAEILALLGRVPIEKIQSWDIKPVDFETSEIQDWRRGIIFSVKDYANQEQRVLLEIVGRVFELSDLIANFLNKK